MIKILVSRYFQDISGMIQNEFDTGNLEIRLTRVNDVIATEVAFYGSKFPIQVLHYEDQYPNPQTAYKVFENLLSQYVFPSTPHSTQFPNKNLTPEVQ